MSANWSSPVDVCEQIKASVNEAFDVIVNFLTRPDRGSQAASDEVRAKLHVLRQAFLDYEPVLNRIANQLSGNTLGELRQIVRTVCETIDERLESLPEELTV